MILLEVFVFGFALWLGTYLISRNPRDLRLGLAGGGLVVYALGLALDILINHAADTAVAATLTAWQRPLLFVPAILWLILLIVMLRGADPWYSRLQNHKRPFLIIIIATIFFGLGLGMVLFPLGWIPRSWLLLAIGGDLVLLGVAVAMLDAIDAGERLWLHSARSFIYAFFFALIFGGQVALVMGMATGITTPMIALLLTIIGVAICSQTFAEPAKNLLDRLAPGISMTSRQTQTTLRETAAAIPRQNPTLDLTTLDEDEFTRLTRRALSHMNNLPRLSASPLMRLPQITQRLQQRELPADTLQRAAELRALLTESIKRLKPQSDQAFGTTDEWRFYNALYIPYVLGLKPYSRREYAGNDEVETAVQPTLDWFRSQVPQRTLYNWQNAAAKLVAQDLRERATLSPTLISGRV